MSGPPREPTIEMLEAAWSKRSGSFADIWQAMLDAAPATFQNTQWGEPTYQMADGSVQHGTAPAIPKGEAPAAGVVEALWELHTVAYDRFASREELRDSMRAAIRALAATDKKDE
jgi:hypothetical protein